jgi:glycosyltransferase involved in cell wall biosynthesis
MTDRYGARLRAAGSGYLLGVGLRIAMLAPPWIPIPPPAYGGVERVIELLTEELIRRGHEVTLFAPPGTRSRARVRSVLAQPEPDNIQMSLFEADHVAAAFDGIAQGAPSGAPYDIVHDHSGFTAFAFAHRLATPLVQTLHGPFTKRTRAFYRRHGHKAAAIAISRYQAGRAPRELAVVAVVANPVIAAEYPFVEKKSRFVLWVGRMDDDKGPQRAIAAARKAGVPLVLAGPVQPHQRQFFGSEVAPHLDRDGITYVGEVGGKRRLRLFSEAAALLMPIRWPEPFGLVMAEAMACGTPVIAFPQGAAPEVVDDGRTGFLVPNEEEMAAAIHRLGEIDPAECRRRVEDRYDVGPVGEAHERAYGRTLDRSSSP